MYLCTAYTRYTMGITVRMVVFPWYCGRALEAIGSAALEPFCCLATSHEWVPAMEDSTIGPWTVSSLGSDRGVRTGSFARCGVGT